MNSATVRLMLSPETKAVLQERARRDGLGLSAYIRRLLLRYLEQNGAA